MPVRFSPMTTTFRMLPIARIQAGIGGGLVAAREPEKAAEAGYSLTKFAGFFTANTPGNRRSPYARGACA